MRNLEPTLILGECAATLGDTPDPSISCLTELIQAEISPSQLQESTTPSLWAPFQCSQAEVVRDRHPGLASQWEGTWQRSLEVTLPRRVENLCRDIAWVHDGPGPTQLGHRGGRRT